MRRLIVPLGAAVVLAFTGATPATAQSKCGQPFEVPVGTPSKVIAKMVVDQIFDGVVLTDAQRTKAITIVETSSANLSKLDPKSADFPKRQAELQDKRDAELM